MIALIFGWGEGDSNLVESTIGIYDSEESVPEKYKISEKNIHYLGFRNELSEDEIRKYRRYSGPCYIRLQEIKINEKIHLLDYIGKCFSDN